MKSSEGNLALSSKRPWVVFMSFVGLIAATFLAFGRLSIPAQGTIWAEDGAIFLQDAMSRRGILDVFAPYQGYLHVVPRAALKFVARFVSVDDYATAISFLSCGLVALIAVLVFHCSKALTENVLVRLAWASITILVGPGPLETLGNLANIHWYLLWLAPWILLKPAQSRPEGVVLFAAAALASLTEILTLMFVPLYLFRLLHKRYWPARAGLLLGILCQIVTTISYPRSAPSEPVNLGSVVEGWFLNSSSAVVFGTSSQISRNIANFGAWPVVLAALPFFLAFIYLLLKGSSQVRLLSVIFVVASVGAWSAAMTFNFSKSFDYSTFDAGQWRDFLLGRYSTVPSMFLLALLPLLAASVEKVSRPAMAGVLAAMVVLQCLYFFPSTAFRQEGPVWADGVEKARQACGADPTLVELPVGIAPGTWKVHIRCDQLLP